MSRCFWGLIERMGIINRRRLKEWAKAVGGLRNPLTLWKMVLLAIGRNAGRKLWWSRMRKCRQCPIYNRDSKTCGPNAVGFGCGCYMPFKSAKTQATCWSDDSGLKIGWNEE